MECALFITCLTDTFYPRVGEAVVRVLRHFDCTVRFPAAQTCCGQPGYNAGFHDDARRLAKRMIRVFAPFEHVVTPSASCATMVRRHFPELLANDPWRQAAERLAERTYEFTTFLRDVIHVDLAEHLRFDTPVTFHFPCHARETYSPAQLEETLRRAAGERLRTPKPADLCCGFGGTFAVDYDEISGAMLRDKLETLTATGAKLVVCNEGGCALNLAGGARRGGRPLRFKHVAECLAESLGLMEPET